MPVTAPDVLLVVNDLAPYGSQRVAVSLVEQWAPERSVVVATLESPAPTELDLPAGAARVALRRSGPRAWALLSLALQVRALVRRERPRHVVAHMTFASTITLLALRGTGVRPVVVEHNLLSSNLAEQSGGRVTRLLLRLLHPGAAVVVGVSDAVVEDVHATVGVPRERLRRLYNPVPHRAARSRECPHPWLAEDRDVTTFVCSGAFRRAKGQDVLVDALALMRAEGDVGSRVILLGDGALADDVAARVRAAGCEEVVHLAGFQEDAAAWVSRADALVMPSRWDSFGLVAVEAARCGVPVVATDVPGLREVVPARAPGWLVPPEDPAALAALLGSLRRPVRAPAGADLGEFEPPVVAERYWRLMEDVALRRVDGRRP